MGKFVDITGQKFGKLTALNRVGDTGHNKGAKWSFKCECGSIKEIAGISVRSGLTTSCGCFRRDKMFLGFEEISKSYWSRVEHGAKIRNLAMEITIEQAWNIFLNQNRKCALTGLELCFVRDYTTKCIQQTASLDRINNSIGYTIENIRWLHKDVNLMKNNYTDEEYIYFCKKVAEHASKPN